MSNTAARVRNLLFRTESALEGDVMGDAIRPELQERLASVTRMIGATQDTEINMAEMYRTVYS